MRRATAMSIAVFVAIAVLVVGSAYVWTTRPYATCPALGEGDTPNGGLP